MGDAYFYDIGKGVLRNHMKLEVPQQLDLGTFLPVPSALIQLLLV